MGSRGMIGGASYDGGSTMMHQMKTDERGSLPLTILASIVLAGVVAVLFGVVQSGISSSGRDRDFASAVQVADAGLQEAYVHLQDALLAQVDDDITFEGVECDQPNWFTEENGENDDVRGACLGDLGEESQFDWSYEWDDAEGAFDVLAVGRHRSSARALQILVEMETLAQSGITGENFAGWTGGGGGSDSDPFWIGTFSCLQLPPSAPDNLEGINYYGDDLAHHRSTCWTPNYAQDLPVVTSAGPDLSWDPAKFHCGPDAVDGDIELTEDVPDEVVRGEAYCVERAHFPEGFEIVAPESDADSDEPVQIYVFNAEPGNKAEAVRVGGQGLADEVNWTNDGPGVASDLQVYVSHGSGDAHLRPPHSRAAMVLWAPGDNCTVTSNGVFHGVMTCKEVVVHGTYDFDSSAGLVEKDTPIMRQFTEERVPSERRPFAEPQE